MSKGQTGVPRQSQLDRVGRALIGTLRREEILLVGIWCAGALLAVSSDTGSLNLQGVFLRYFSFFGSYLLLMFLASRLLFLVSEKWRPKHPIVRRIYSWLFGADVEIEPNFADSLIMANVRELAAQKRPSVLGMDIELIRGLFLIYANLTLYSNIKVRIPFINTTVGDPLFQRMDEAIFGADFVANVQNWFSGNADVAKYFGDMYLHDYVWMIVLVAIFYLRRDQFSLRWLFMSVCLVYMIGILMTVAYPSFGPCFINPEQFAWLKGTPIGQSQKWLGSFYMRSVDIVNSGRPLQAMAFTGIAAFPSLHVAHMVILIVVALRTVRFYALWLAWVTTGTAIATVGFGWHYAVDAIGGIVIAVAITEGIYRLMRRWDGLAPVCARRVEEPAS